MPKPSPKPRQAREGKPPKREKKARNARAPRRRQEPPPRGSTWSLRYHVAPRAAKTTAKRWNANPVNLCAHFFRGNFMAQFCACRPFSGFFYLGLYNPVSQKNWGQLRVGGVRTHPPCKCRGGRGWLSRSNLFCSTLRWPTAQATHRLRGFFHNTQRCRESGGTPQAKHRGWRKAPQHPCSVLWLNADPSRSRGHTPRAVSVPSGVDPSHGGT